MGNEEKIIENIYADLGEIYNNIEDDLEMDKTGESGYKTHKEVVKAIEKYTLKVIKTKYRKWEKIHKKNAQKSTTTSKKKSGHNSRFKKDANPLKNSAVLPKTATLSVIFSCGKKLKLPMEDKNEL